MPSLDSEAMENTLKRRDRRKQQNIVSLQVDDVPVWIKKRLVAAARKRGGNMSDVAVEALAAKFRVPFIPSEKRSPIAPGLTSTTLILKMPHELRQRIKQAALDREVSAREIVLETLALRLKR